MNKGNYEGADRTGRPRADTVSTNGQFAEGSNGKSSHAILLIDDRAEVASAMEIAFRMAGHRLTVASGPEEAFSLLARTRFDAIVLDLNFTPGRTDGREGLACLERIMADDPAACVVVLTAHGGMRIAVAAMQAGARDFAVKPWKNADLIAKVEAAIARESVVEPVATPSPDTVPAALLGESAPIERVRALIRRVGPTSAGVAITGPSGAGRTLTALSLHRTSQHAATAPLRIDLREDGALAALDGAHGTAILRHPDRLDEPTQDRLARALSEAVRPIAIVDSIAALTPGLHRRIATIELAVPGLSERQDDIPILARHFLREAAERFGRPLPRLDEAAEAALRAAEWPDEVRGLALAMERATLLADGAIVDAAMLFSGTAAASPPKPDAGRDYDLERSQKAMIAAALAEHHNNVSHTAKALGLSRGALYRRMERYGL